MRTAVVARRTCTALRGNTQRYVTLRGSHALQVPCMVVHTIAGLGCFLLVLSEEHAGDEETHGYTFVHTKGSEYSCKEQLSDIRVVVFSMVTNGGDV